MTFVRTFVDWTKLWQPMGIELLGFVTNEPTYVLVRFHSVSEATLGEAYQDAQERLHPSCYVESNVLHIPVGWSRSGKQYLPTCTVMEFERRFPGVYKKVDWKMEIMQKFSEEITVYTEQSRLVEMNDLLRP